MSIFRNRTNVGMQLAWVPLSQDETESFKINVIIQVDTNSKQIHNHSLKAHKKFSQHQYSRIGSFTISHFKTERTMQMHLSITLPTYTSEGLNSGFQ